MLIAFFLTFATIENVYMIINNNYLVQRVEALIKEKQQSAGVEQKENNRLYRIKLRFPKWLRNMIFHPYNPAYSVYLQSKVYKNNDKRKYIGLTPVHPQAVDFIKYCFANDFTFDTSVYYPESDEKTLGRVVDNRIKSVLGGYGKIALDKDQQDYYKQSLELKAKVCKEGTKYRLNVEGSDYFLPENSFPGQTYIHDYGLRYLPEYVKEYIEGKDFLDFGAYIGDASIFFAKKYNPRRLYAYEPIAESAKRVAETVKMNNIDCITVVQKGIGDTIEDIDIFIDPLASSSCSINNSMVSSENKSQRISISTIDNDCKDMHVGLIKMDIEGAEYAAIKGGLEVIKRDKPVLLISMYHTGKDFFEIPPMLKEAVPDYKFRFLDLEAHFPLYEKILVAYPQQ